MAAISFWCSVHGEVERGGASDAPCCAVAGTVSSDEFLLDGPEREMMMLAGMGTKMTECDLAHAMQAYAKETVAQAM